MTRDEAVARVQQDLGFRSDRSTEIISRLQEAQRLHERGLTLPSFLLLEDQTLSLTAGDPVVDLPDDFLRRSPNKPRFTPTNEKTTFLTWKNFDVARQTFFDSESEHPQIVTLRKDTLIFYPTSDVDLTIYWDYYKKDDLLTTNIENLWLANAPEILWGWAGIQIAQALRNKAAYDLFTATYKTAVTRWFQETVLEEQEDDMILGANN